MKIQIVGFRCYEDFTLEIPDNKVTNLSGNSGVGKSTIFTALYWCLFGSVRNIYNLGKKFKKTFVKIELQDIIIYRQAKPCLLKVNFKNLDHEDDAAQDVINCYLGTKKLWQCTSYIPQNERNILLCGTNSDKIDLINKLTFSEENIEQHITTIENKISFLENKIKLEKASLDSTVKDLDLKVNLDLFVLPADRPKILLEFKNLKDQFSRIQKLVSEKTVILGKISVLSDQKTKILEQLDNLVFQDTSEIKNKINFIRKNLVLQSKHLDYLTASQKLNCMKVDLSKHFTENDYTKAKNTEAEIKLFKNICNKYKVDYTPECISKSLKDSELIISTVPDMKKARDYRELLASISNIRFDPVDDTEIQNVQNEIRLILESQKSVPCPVCKNNLKIIGTNLVKVENFNNRIHELPDLKQKLERLLKADDLKKKKNSLIEKSKLYNPEILKIKDIPDQTVKELYQKISELKNVRYLKLETESDIIRKHLDYYNLKNSVIQIPDPGTDFTEKDLNDLTENLTSVENKNQEIKFLTDNLYDINSKLENLIVPDVIDTCPELKSKMNIVELKISNFQILDFYLEKLKTKDKLVLSIENLQKELDNTEQLKKHGLLLEYKTLQDTIDSLTLSVNTILEKLFDDQIQLKFLLFKTNKAGKTKPEVNLTIQYKDGEYTDINEMSGGEGDRVSLALTLALSQIASSPIVLLDETMTSLNIDLQEKCLDILKDIKKTVICIDHESIEGYYDHVITL